MKLLVFDIDDTLTKTAELHQRFFVECLKKLGSKKDSYDFGSYIHHTDSYIFREIYTSEIDSDYSFQCLIDFESMMINKFNKERIIEIRGAKSFLNNVEVNNDYCYCFATGSLKKPAQFKLDSLGLSEYNSVLACSNDIESREDIVTDAIEKSKMEYSQDEFDDIILFGDGIWDLKTAKNLNINFFGIGEKNKRLLLDSGCEWHSDDFAGVTLEGL
ncbi:MAG: HAD family hydrolase [Chlorobiota bacterium]